MYRLQAWFWPSSFRAQYLKNETKLRSLLLSRLLNVSQMQSKSMDRRLYVNLPNSGMMWDRFADSRNDNSSEGLRDQCLLGFFYDYYNSELLPQLNKELDFT